MRKVFITLVLSLTFFYNYSSAQCLQDKLTKPHIGRYVAPKYAGIYTQIQDQSIFYGSDESGIDAGEYFEIELKNGNTYTISGGSSTSVATVFKPESNGNYTVVTSGNIGAVNISFLAPVDGNYRVLISNNVCSPFAGISNDPIIRVACTSCAAAVPTNLGSCDNAVNISSGGIVSFEGQTAVTFSSNFPFNTDPLSPFFNNKIEGTHDVYRTFTATSNTMIVQIKDYEILNKSGSVRADDLFAIVYPASCNNSEVIAKRYFNGGAISNGNVSEWLVSGLTVGTNYNLKFSTDCGVDYSRNATTGNFTGIFNWVKFYVKTYPVTPENDYCTSAISLTPSNVQNCTNATKARLAFATNSGNNSCNADVNLVDVWYKFIATSTKHSILIQGNNAELLYGANCNNLTALKCLNRDSAVNGVHNVEGLAIGQTYYLRIYNRNIIDPINPLATFDVCVLGVPITCTNPELTITTKCIDANSYQAIVNINKMGSSTTVNITNTVGLPAINAIGVTGTYIIAPIANNSANAAITIVSVDNSDCNITVPITQNCQIAPLPNDDCEGAYTVTLGNFSCTATTTGFTTTATKSTTQEGACVAPLNGKDIWFTSTNTTAETKSIVIKFGTGTAQQYRYEIYKTSTNCNNLQTALLCGSVGFETEGGNRRLQRIDNVAAGEKLYIRVWAGLNLPAQNGTVTVCAFVAPNESYTCTTSKTIPVNAGLTAISNISGNNIGASMQEQQCNPQNTPIAFSTDAFGLYYHFTATSSKHVIKYFSKTALVGNDNSLETKVYTEDICGSGNKALVACGETDSVLLSNLIVGQLYRIYTYNNLPDNRTSYQVAVLTVPLEDTNDNCNTALTLTPTANCNNATQASTFGATTSLQAACTGVNDDDVWFKFVASASSHRIQLTDISSVVGNSTQMVVQAFIGPCNALTSISDCVAGQNVVDITNLTIGTTYYFRVYTSQAANNVLFKVCVSNVPAPNNDECSNAINVSISDFNCSQTASGTTVAATESMPRCSGTGVAAVNDVWYKFTATSTAHNIHISSDHYVELFDGNCGSLQSITCGYESINSNQFTIGKQYFVRVYQSITPNSFTICVSTLPPAPSNDLCINAQTLILSNSATNNWYTGTTVGALRDTGTCFNANDDMVQDVWYKFTATSSKTVIDFENIVYPQTNANGSLNLQLYSGACNNLQSIACASNVQTGQLLNTAIGTQYFIRIFTTASSSVGGANFKVLVRNLIVPVNNEPANAVTLTQNIVNIATKGTVEGATPTSTNCSGSLDNDVWFKFIATSTNTEIHFTANNSIAFSYQVLDSSLNNIGCFTNLVTTIVGKTYYIRIWDVNTSFSPVVGVNAAFNIGVSGGLPTTTVYNDNIGNCEVNTTLLSTGSQKWLTLTKNGNLVFSIFDSEPMGNIASNIFIANPANNIRTDVNGTEYLDRNFAIAPQQQPASAVKVAFYFTELEWNKFLAANDADSNDVVDIANIKITKFNADNCNFALLAGMGSLISPISYGRVGNNYFAVFEFSSFSSFFFHGGNTALNSTSTLPVVCTQFDAKQVQNNVRLTWITTQETNNAGFNIERSTNGIIFETIGYVLATTASASNHTYQFLDAQLTNTTKYYYRIKQIDKDNRSTFICTTKFIQFTNVISAVSIFPNPSSNYFTLSSNYTSNDKATLKVTDVNGRLLLQTNITSSSQRVDISQLQPGTYIVVVTSNNMVKNLKLIKQ